MQNLNHFKTGYIVDSIAKTISETRIGFTNGSKEQKEQLDQLQGLLLHVTSFDVYFPESQELNYFKLNPVLATLNNILTRGLPTKTPLFISGSI